MVKNWISMIIVISLIAVVALEVIDHNKKSITEEETAKVAEATKKTETTEVAATNENAQAEYVAPDFELKTLDGKTVRLSDYAGKKVLLNFWATWCPPCNEEAPHMQKIYEQYKNQGVEILAVNVTSQDKGKDAVAQFAKKYGLTFEIVLDEEGLVGNQYQILTLPTSYMIDAKGNIVEAIEGPMDEALMKKLIEKAEH